MLEKGRTLTRTSKRPQPSQYKLYRKSHTSLLATQGHLRCTIVRTLSGRCHLSVEVKRNVGEDCLNGKIQCWRIEGLEQEDIEQNVLCVRDASGSRQAIQKEAGSKRKRCAKHSPDPSAMPLRPGQPMLGAQTTQE